MKKKNLLNNFSLKLISVAIAVLVWLSVVNIDDPITTEIVQGVRVQVKNEQYIESAGQMCLIPEDYDIISVEVTGKRSVVDKITAENIVATADLQQIVDMSTDPVMVPISVSCSGIQPGNIRAIPQNMSISLDSMMSQEFLISGSAGEAEPARGYEIGGLAVSPEKVKITGPQSLIQKIDKVVATIEKRELTEDTVISTKLSIIDKNQETLTDSQMEYLKYDNISSPTVNVSIDLWAVRNDIKIQGGYVGEPEEGYKVEKISFTPDLVSVAGSDKALEELAIAGNVIEVPSESIDVSGATEDFDVKISLASLLPDDVILTKDTSDTVLATVSVMPQDSQEYSISSTSIQAENIPDGLLVGYEIDSIQVRVREGTADLTQLKASDIRASIDLTGRAEGSYTIPVDITLPSGYELVDQVDTTVKLSSATPETNESNE